MRIRYHNLETSWFLAPIIVGHFDVATISPHGRVPVSGSQIRTFLDSEIPKGARTVLVPLDADQDVHIHVEIPSLQEINVVTVKGSPNPQFVVIPIKFGGLVQGPPTYLEELAKLDQYSKAQYIPNVR